MSKQGLSIRRLWIFFFVIFYVVTVQSVACAGLSEPKNEQPDVKKVKVETVGRCAVENFTPRQAQRLAIRQARALAIEKAAGVKVTSTSLVTNGALAGDFIKSFSSGYIVKEDIQWLPITQYQKDATRPPIIEYGLKLSAVVSVPTHAPSFSGLRAQLNQHSFRAYKEKMTISVSSRHACRVAIFNIMADDTVVMLYPYGFDDSCVLAAQGKKVFPPQEGDELLVAPLPGNKKDTEAILVAALPEDSTIHWEDIYTTDEQMSLTEFFTRYSTIIGSGDDVVLPYEVFE